MRRFRGRQIEILLAACSIWLALGWAGCGQKKASPKADRLALEQAFNLPAATPAPNGNSPAAVAAKAVAAIKAEDWVTAVPLLHQLRSMPGLTADQFEAVHNANGNAYVRLVEMADRGSVEAKAVLDRLKQEHDRR